MTYIYFLLFPGVLQLDLTGAYGVLAGGPDVRIDLVWKTLLPVRSADGLLLTPTKTFGECISGEAQATGISEMPDVICVPGGAGILPLLEDGETLDFLRYMGANARYVASICTGSLVLGAAGLLNGYKATTHWQSLGLLPCFKAEPVSERIVQDRNRITAAGVTSGIDMALLLAAHLWGEEKAREIQLSMEYDPQPPFNSGSPSTALPQTIKSVESKTATRQEARKQAVLRAAEKIPYT